MSPTPWDIPPAESLQRETDFDSRYRDAIFAFIRENAIAMLSGFVFGLLATAGLAWVVAEFLL
jgi:hypothetical protein